MRARVEAQDQLVAGDRDEAFACAHVEVRASGEPRSQLIAGLADAALVRAHLEEQAHGETRPVAGEVRDCRCGLVGVILPGVCLGSLSVGNLAMLVELPAMMLLMQLIGMCEYCGCHSTSVGVVLHSPCTTAGVVVGLCRDLCMWRVGEFNQVRLR